MEKDGAVRANRTRCDRCGKVATRVDRETGQAACEDHLNLIKQASIEQPALKHAGEILSNKHGR